ncbi:hypothetical protein [Shewanella sp. NIFS-20-20]|uniref:hypothetical protein n=1 Tax=Shewanella sp. NIFS-20-20 TaxID=2853806 RepID=UPI001C46E8A8|nr:hypothetical protein [Shewanella sp. NIFS-20-20]MBV7314673.1 hypothetical protein [Shewanella sp. NIFS-20-20]
MSGPSLAVNHLTLTHHSSQTPSLASATFLEQQVRVCQAGELAECLARLPAQWQQALPSAPRLLVSLGQHGAMSVRVTLGAEAGDALPNHSVASYGLILLATANLPTYASAYSRGQYWQLPLAQQALMSQWHEAGHLVIAHLQDQAVLPSQLSKPQQETLADIYSIWRSAHHFGDLALGWQQYHRRNLALIDSVDNVSHWSVPVLQPLLAQLPLEQWLQAQDFADFIGVSPLRWRLPKHRELNELASLTQQSFGEHSGPKLARYLYWRREQLWQLLSPTLAQFLTVDELAQLQQEFID